MLAAEESSLQKIEELVKREVESKNGIITVGRMRELCKNELSENVSYTKMKNIITQNLKLSWKKIRNQDFYVDKSENIALRIDYARELMGLIENRKVIINFDETVIRQSDNSSYSWEQKCITAHRKIGKPISGLSLLLAVTSQGDLYF